MGLHLGLDIFSWFSVGGRLELSSHDARVPPPPDGEYFQLYEGSGEARISLRIGRFSVYGEAALGMAMISTNILESVGLLEPGERFSSKISGGGGLEYQLQNRHYALGAGGAWSILPGFGPMRLWDARAYLRYTY
jgi:hypothetical protein